MSDEESNEDGATPERAHATAVLDHVVKAVVGDPDAVVVNVDGGGGDTLSLTVEVGPDDMGRVIGRRGRIANAIRTVVRAAGVRDGVTVDVEFLD
ncbi:MAG: KH domain-containing protein [Acidimicrobiales bacterium]